MLGQEHLDTLSTMRELAGIYFMEAHAGCVVQLL